MEQNAFIMEAISGVVYLIVGVRLYALSRRTRQTPEYLIALTFLFWALCYALYDIPYALSGADESAPPFFAFTSLLAFDLGNVFFALFTREVFRKHTRWANALVVAIGLSMLFGAAGTAWVGDWEQINPVANPGYWPQTIGGLAPSVWMCVEGFIQYVKARRRLKLGLCEPLLCHHFLLWGIAGALWTGLELVLVAQDHIYLSAGEWSGTLGIVNGVLEIVPIAIMWLIFFPPAAYRRWIAGAVTA